MKRGAYAAPNWANSQRLGSAGAKAVLMLLAAYADEDFSCYPGQERLAEETELHVATVQRHLNMLEEVGLLHREARYAGKATRKTDRYYLHLDVTVTVAECAAARARVKARGGRARPRTGGYPQDSSSQLPRTVPGSSESVPAGQELPSTVRGSSNYLANEGVNYIAPGARKELLERELLEGVEFEEDLTRNDAASPLSTAAAGDEPVDDIDPDVELPDTHDVDEARALRVIDLRDHPRLQSVASDPRVEDRRPANPSAAEMGATAARAMLGTRTRRADPRPYVPLAFEGRLPFHGPPRLPETSAAAQDGPQRASGAR